VASQLIEMSKLRQSFAAGGRHRRREKKEPGAGTNHDEDTR